MIVFVICVTVTVIVVFPECFNVSSVVFPKCQNWLKDLGVCSERIKAGAGIVISYVFCCFLGDAKLLL